MKSERQHVARSVAESRKRKIGEYTILLQSVRRCGHLKDQNNKLTLSVFHVKWSNVIPFICFNCTPAIIRVETAQKGNFGQRNTLRVVSSPTCLGNLIA